MIETPVMTTQSDMTIVPVRSYVSTQTATDRQIVPNTDLGSPTRLFDTNEQVVTPAFAGANLGIQNFHLSQDEDLFYAWLFGEQYRADRKKQNELFDDVDNRLEEFEELALLESLGNSH